MAVEQFEQIVLSEEIVVARCGQLSAFVQTPAEFREGVLLGQREAVVDPTFIVVQQKKAMGVVQYEHTRR